MVGAKDIGRAVTIRAAGDFYAYIDGWSGVLAGFQSGYAEIHVADETVDAGHKVFLVPPEEVEPNGLH